MTIPINSGKLLIWSQATNYTQELNQTEDIDDQSNSSNYGYSKTGQLIKNTQEGISLIEWTVYGKISKVTKANGTVIEYKYDPSEIGQKIVKIGNQSIEHFYFRDIQGNTLAVYTNNLNNQPEYLVDGATSIWKKQAGHMEP